MHTNPQHTNTPSVSRHTHSNAHTTPAQTHTTPAQKHTHTHQTHTSRTKHTHSLSLSLFDFFLCFILFLKALSSFTLSPALFPHPLTHSLPYTLSHLHLHAHTHTHIRAQHTHTCTGLGTGGCSRNTQGNLHYLVSGQGGGGSPFFFIF